MSRRTVRPVAGFVVGVALALAACTGDGSPPTTTTGEASATTTTTPPPRQADGVLTIGVSMPITGSGSNLGTPIRDAMREAVQRINRSGGVLGNDVVLVEEDEGTDRSISTLIDAGVDAIIGPASSNVAMSQLQLITRDGQQVVTCSPTATATSLDEYPDGGYFYRTVPSDSLQMVAIARLVQNTGLGSVGVAYLDDPYGRGLLEAFEPAATADGRIDLVDPVGFSGDEEDLSELAAELVAGDPGAIVILSDGDDGARFLTALGEQLEGAQVPPIFTNDPLRNARRAIANLPPEVRAELVVVAPQARMEPLESSGDGDQDPELLPAFAAHAIDCINLISLAAVNAESDAPGDFRRQMAEASTGGAECVSFEECIELQTATKELNIDYDGLSGPLDIGSDGDPVSAEFIAIDFDDTGNETSPLTTFTAEY